MSVSVVPAGAETAPLAARLHAAAFAEDAWGEAAFARLLALPGVLGLLALRDGEPAGLVLLRLAADEAEVLTLAVAPAHRRRGVGRHLVEAAAAAAAGRGAARLFLEVAETNAAARRLYAQLGFAAIGRRSRYYPDGTDAVLLARALTPPCAG